MWKYSWRGLFWMVTQVFHQFHHFLGSQWSYRFFWFWNLKCFPTFYWHPDSSVPCFCGSCSPQRLVHVVVRTWEPQVPETRRSKRIRIRMLVKVNMSILSSPVSTKFCGSDSNNWYLARGSCCAWKRGGTYIKSLAILLCIHFKKIIIS